MKKKSTAIAILLSLLLALIGSLKVPVYADEQTEEETTPAPGAVLELTPVNKRIALDPGETRESSITVKNLSDDTISFFVYATPFSNGDGGETQDFETETRYTQISHWISIRKDGNFSERAEFSLEAKKSKEITYKITVPDSATAGGQYASIIVELVPVSDNIEGIQTISRAGMVLFANVSGDIERASEINDIKAQIAAIGKNIDIHYTVKNKGNIDFQSSAEIVISSLFGKELYRNNTLSTVFPENSKTVVAEWGDTPAFGIYRLNYDISALNINATGSQLVLVIQPLILGLFVVLGIGAITGIVYLVKRHTIDKDKNIVIG